MEHGIVNKYITFSDYVVNHVTFCLEHWKKVKFPGLVNYRKCQENLEWNFLDKPFVICYLGNVTWQAYFLNLRKFHISCTFPWQGNMTFPAYFQWCQKFHISCTIPSKDTWNFLYISCNIRNFMCPAYFQDQGHNYDIYCTFPVHILQHQKFYISCTFTRQGHIKIPAYFLWYQKFHVSCTFPLSRTCDIYCTFP